MTFFSPWPCFSTVALTFAPSTSGLPTLMSAPSATSSTWSKEMVEPGFGVELLDLQQAVFFNPVLFATGGDHGVHGRDSNRKGRAF